MAASADKKVVIPRGPFNPKAPLQPIYKCPLCGMDTPDGIQFLIKHREAGGECEKECDRLDALYDAKRNAQS